MLNMKTLLICLACSLACNMQAMIVTKSLIQSVKGPVFVLATVHKPSNQEIAEQSAKQLVDSLQPLVSETPIVIEIRAHELKKNPPEIAATDVFIKSLALEVCARRKAKTTPLFLVSCDERTSVSTQLSSAIAALGSLYDKNNNQSVPRDELEKIRMLYVIACQRAGISSNSVGQFFGQIDTNYEALQKFLSSNPKLSFLDEDLKKYAAATQCCKRWLQRANPQEDIGLAFLRLMSASELVNQFAFFKELFNAWIAVDALFVDFTLLKRVLECLELHQGALVVSGHAHAFKFLENADQLGMRILDNKSAYEGPEQSMLELVERALNLQASILESAEKFVALKKSQFPIASAQPAEEKLCAVCNKAATKSCSQCKIMRYCSRDCQAVHWPTHKLTCKKHEIDAKIS